MLGLKATLRFAGFAIFIAGTFLSTSSYAQQVVGRFAVQRYQPTASSQNYLMTHEGRVLPHLHPSFGLILNYGHLPLAIEGPDGDVTNKFLKYQLALDVAAAIAFWDRVEIGFVLPVNLAQGSEDFSGLTLGDTLSSAGIGDLKVIPKIRLFTAGIFTATLVAPIALPTGDQENMLSDDGFGITPTAVLAFDIHERFAFAVNAGYRVRPKNTFEFPGQGQVTVDDEFVASLGARYGLWQDKIDLIGDGQFAMSVKEFDREEVGGEILGGLRFFLPLGFQATVAAGPGIGGNLGTPTFRVLGDLRWTLPVAKKKEVKPDPIKDSDGDGILDPDDKCPNDPEDKDKFEDEDGCPDPDNDKDGVLDVKDKCPMDPEDKDSFEDEDGCPDPDNDKDGILDVNDKCPLKPEDKDNFQDEDGCPDPDNDNDGILDVKDQCPNEPETFNGVKDEDGCPDKSKGKVKVAHGKIEVPPVYFATNRDKILRRSFKTLESVAKVIKLNKWIKKVRIEGHTDDRGKDAANMDLSNRRAASVERFLIERGIDSSRLTAQGFGETRPIASNKTRRGRAKNRRVEFVIVDPPMKK